MTLADSLRNVAAYIKLRDGKTIEIDYKAPLWKDIVTAADELDRLLAIESALPDKGRAICKEAIKHLEHVKQLEAIEVALPKCWGLRDGELVQDVPVVPGMTVYIDDPVVRAATVTKVEVCGIIEIGRGFNRTYGRDEYNRTEADKCCDSREAAEKRGEA